MRLYRRRSHGLAERLSGAWRQVSANATSRPLIGINALQALSQNRRTVETPKARCEHLSLGALDEHVDIGGDFDGDAVDRQGTVSPLLDGGERGVGEDRVTGAEADG
jgi:hypothetical protein